MDTYLILSNDSYYEIKAKDSIEAIYNFYVFGGDENETVKKAILSANNIKEAIEMYNELSFDDDDISYIFNIKDNYIK